MNKAALSGLSATPPIAPEICAAYRCRETTCQKLAGGLINQTFLLTPPGTRPFILQRLSPIFKAAVLNDIEAVTAHLKAHGLTTPKLIKTADNQLFVSDNEGFIWRALTYIPGQTFLATPTALHAESAGRLLGEYHRVLSDFNYNFQHIREHVHDSPWHFGELKKVLGATPDFSGLADLKKLAAAILKEEDNLLDFKKFSIGTLHGDPKIANFLYHETKALTMVDLDTFARRALITELADALRSFAAPAEDAENAAFKFEYWEAFLTGYEQSNKDALIPLKPFLLQAVRTISLELAARFAKEAFIPQNFAWDSSKFASAHEHNLARAAGQYNLAMTLQI